MTLNIGILDRSLRLLLALILYLSFGGIGALIIVLWLAVTGIFRVCPLYDLLGFHTCVRAP